MSFEIEELDIEKFRMTMSLGRGLIGDALTGKLKDQPVKCFCPKEVEIAIEKFATIMLYAGYEEGIRTIEKMNFNLTDEIMIAKSNMPVFPYIEL